MKELKSIMEKYAILNCKKEKLLDFYFEPVEKLEDAEIYDTKEDAQDELKAVEEPFCKIIKVSNIEKELQKARDYNNLGGMDLYSLKYGQKFKILQKGWEGRIFVWQKQEIEPVGGRIFLYEKENWRGAKINMSEATAHTFRVEVVNN